MGADIGVIIPSGFRDVRDKRKAEQFLRETADSLSKELMIDNIAVYMYDDYCDGKPLAEEWPDYLLEISIPYYGATLQLFEGFWFLYNGYRYYQLFCPTGTQWLRHEIFDIVRALGQKEAWYCSEYGIDDEVGPENYTLESWLEKASRSPDGITEYNLRSIVQEGEAIESTYAEYYHDSYADVFPLFDKIAKKVAPNRLLGLSAHEDGRVRVLQPDGNVSRVRIKTTPWIPFLWFRRAISAIRKSSQRVHVEEKPSQRVKDLVNRHDPSIPVPDKPLTWDYLDTLSFTDRLLGGQVEIELTGLVYYCTKDDLGPVNGIIRPEPDNPYDPQAMVAIRADGKRIGYIPRSAQKDYKRIFGGQRSCPFAGWVLITQMGWMFANVLITVPKNRNDVERKLSHYVANNHPITDASL